MKKRKIYCANCIFCKIVREKVGEEEHTLRLRCGAGKWKKKLGGEKLYKYFTIMKRSAEYCDAYEAMGDEKIFLKELKSSLPLYDEIYRESGLKPSGVSF